MISRRPAAVQDAATVNDLVRDLETNGHCLFTNLLDGDFVSSRRAELAQLLDEDIEYRRRHGISGADLVREGYTYSLTPHMHTMLFPAFRSNAASDVLEAILSHRVIAEVMERTVGKYFRLRVDLVRRATAVDDGVDDFQLPHEWHRDSPGEFTFGVFFDDMTVPLSGGTAAINGGTHFLPYDPIWDFMFGSKTYTSKENYLANHNVFVRPDCRKVEVFTRIFKRTLRRRFVEIRGKPGDVYLFLNDAWHGRAPNRQGKQFMTMRFGGYPTDFPFKDDLPLPRGPDLLPPRLRLAYSADQPVNERQELLIYRLRRARAPLLARLAHLEKQIAVACTEAA
jgi:ectoine hydroxylase-related dioxygenase (phytanoyl-CoA dioxygenase family)